MKFLSTNLVTESGTTVTASSANSNFPASNLRHPFRSKRWRSAAGVTTANVVFDFQTIEPVDSVVILWPKEDGIRLTGSAVIRIQANATNVWTSPALNQALTVDNYYSVASHFFSTDQNYRYWRLVITDTGNPWGYVEAGVVWIGKSLELQPAQNGFSFGLSDRSSVSSTDFGHEYVDEYPLQAQLEISYQYLDYEAATFLEEAYRTNGNKKPVLVALDPTEVVFDKDHFLLYGKMGSGFRLGHVNYNLFNSDSIIITELA